LPHVIRILLRTEAQIPGTTIRTMRAIDA